MAINLERVDLKMLRVLSVLAQTRNTYRAAEQLHLSQSAVSRALSRLRDILDDPLFIRTAGGLEPTALTERVVARLPELFELLEGVVEGNDTFDPLAMSGEMRIALGSPALRSWGRVLTTHLAQAAPNVTWSLETWRASTSGEILEGGVALGVHFGSSKWPQALYQQRLGRDEYTLMVRTDHPAGRRRPTMKVFERYPLISLLLPDWNDHENLLESTLRSLDLMPKVALRTDNFTLALDRLRHTDELMAGTMAVVQQESDIKAVPYPAEIPLPDAEVVACYPRRLRNSARQRWLVALVAEVITPHLN
ncbi:LysR family transcriptional regulator [Halioglobus maricola]|uniref:LysR family transcriptional regulator n=1 Tax=Halioglobus maricola TaxID=2601894 RepID=A0A5P9NLS7_9GAMM|nr:LysR family transcriptional regulator [Halioglobus maricola]QFU76456.1 LysR family transcriptional regulator [Halioglobus maricola]